MSARNQGGKTASIVRELRRVNWAYPMESYPRGTKVIMLAMDSRNLWSHGGAVIPTLAWIAEREGAVFDSYWAFQQDPSLIHQFFDGRVMEHASLTANYFKIRWLFLGERARNLLHPLGELNDSVLFDSYLQIYRRYVRKYPCAAAVIVPRRHRLDQPNHVKGGPLPPPRYGDLSDYFQDENGDPKARAYPLGNGADVCAFPWARGFGKLQFYFWPEIYFRRALGFTDDADPLALKKLGITRVTTLCCDPEKWRRAGFKVTVGAADAAGDDEWSITLRSFNKWKSKARGIAHSMWAHDKLHPGWLGFLIRNRYIPVYCADWRISMPVVARFARALGNRHIIGGGDHPSRSMGDHNWMRALCGYGLGRWKMPTEPGLPSIKRAMRVRYPRPVAAPWDIEHSDDFLRACAAQNKIAISQIWTITDIGYSAMLPHILDIYQCFQARCGFAFDLPWVEYYGETIQKMFTEAYAAWVEPLLYGTGLSWFFNMRRMPNFTMPDREFAAQLAFARAQCREIMGPEYMPRGHVFGWWGVTPGQRRIIRDLGFEYLVAGASKDYTVKKVAKAWKDYFPPGCDIDPYGRLYDVQRGDVICRMEKDFTQVDFTCLKKDAGQIEACLESEKTLKGPGALLITQDTGGGFMTSAFNYPRGMDGARGPKEIVPKPTIGYNIALRAGFVNYIAQGGETGRIFTCKPRELVRYARLLKGKR